jgi:hypothetical protein
MIAIGDFTIESDGTCFTVKQSRLPKGTGRMATEKIQVDTIGYFGKFSMACKCIANQIILDGSEVADILNKLNELNEEIKSWKGDLVYVCGKIKETKEN